MFGKFFKPKDEPPLPKKEEWVEKLVWLPAGHEQNPFRQEVLDCRPVALSFSSWTSDEKIAENFNRLRNSDGRELIGQLPERVITTEPNLQFPFNGQHNDGPMFVAREMEDKWDFFAYQSRLYIRRSWTGKLMYVAELDYAADAVFVRRVHSEASILYEDANIAGAQVYFLIVTHFGKSLLPFPIPRSISRSEAREIALMGFNSYGRRAQFASYAAIIG